MVYLFTKSWNKLLLGNHHLETFKTFIFFPDSHEHFAHTVQAFLPFCIFWHLSGFIGQFSHQHQLLLFSVVQLDFHYASISSFKIFSELMFQNTFSTHWFCILCMYKQSAAQNGSEHQLFFYLECLHFYFPICIIVLTFSDGDQPLSKEVLLLFTKSDEFFFWWQIYYA